MKELDVSYSKIFYGLENSLDDYLATINYVNNTNIKKKDIIIAVQTSESTQEYIYGLKTSIKSLIIDFT